MTLQQFTQASIPSAFAATTTDDFTTEVIPSGDLGLSSLNKYVYRIYSGSNVDQDRCTFSSMTWLPDGYRRIFRSYVFGPSGFWTMAPLCYAAKFDPFLSLDCAPTPSTLTGLLKLR